MDEQNQPQNPNGIAGKPLVPQVDANGNVFESLQATNAPRPAMPKIDSAEIISNLHKEEALPHLRTYESDIAEAIKHDKASLVNIAVSQNKKEQEKQGNPSTVVIVKDSVAEQPKKKGNALFVVLTILLTFGGLGVLGGGGYYIYSQYMDVPGNPVPPTQQTISSEKARSFVITDSENIQDIIAREIAASGTDASKIGRLVFEQEVVVTTDPKKPATTTQPISAETFAVRLNTQMPSWLSRSFTEYAAGYYTGERTEPFIIFKTNSFENGFAGMLKWETTMYEDLIKILPTPAGTTTSTSSPQWKDRTIQNKNTRVYHLGTGEPVLYYSLSDKETIVITASENSLRELLSRLTVSQFAR